MPSIDKLLNKVNQATSAVKSLKGIKSKFEGGQKYEGTYDKDMLASQKAKAEKLLDDRRATLQSNLNASNLAQAVGKKTPVSAIHDLQYPMNEDLDSFIIFETRPRKKRKGANAKNLFSSESTAVALYVPDELSFDTKVTYEQEGISANKRNLVGGNDQGGDRGFFQKFGSFMEEGFQGLVSDTSNAMTGGVKNFVQGKAKNPMEEQMFKGVEFRDHSFSYEFYPKSAAEAKMVEDIIWTFKTAMLPDTFGNAEADGAAEGYFNYPNIFDIYYEGNIGLHMERFQPSVLTDCTVSHSTKLYEDGYPVSSTMDLSFTEIKIITQETFQDLTTSEKRKDIGGGNMSLNKAVAYDTTFETETYTTWYGAKKTRTKKVMTPNPRQLTPPNLPGKKGGG
jgi:hypothetical protein